MSRLNIYVPDDLAGAAKRLGLNISALAQSAIRARLRAESTDGWLASLRVPPGRQVTHEDVLAALDAAREEAPTRHG